MRVGILTYHSVCNFGANLQALSTVEYLKKNKIEPIVINWVPFQLEEVFKKNTTEAQIEAHNDFVKAHLPVSKLCRTDDELVAVINHSKIDSIIVGSDAVFQHYPLLSRIVFPTRTIVSIVNPTVDKIYPNPFWGTFLKKIKKKVAIAAMSASCQNTEYKNIFGKEKER